MEYVIELGDTHTTLTRLKDSGKITWTNGQQHLPYKIVQAMEEDEVWDLPRYDGGLIMDTDMPTQQQRIIDFKKRIKERVQREYVEGCKPLNKTGNFMEEPDTVEPSTWREKPGQQES